MKFFLLIIMVLVLLFPAESIAKKKKTSQFENITNNLDAKRIKDVIIMGRMIEYFYKKTGYYPAHQGKLGTMNTIIITTNKDAIPKDTMSYDVLQKEFFDVLGERAVLAMDPEDTKKQMGRVYRYKTDGQSYWFSVYLSSKREYTKLEGHSLYKVEISSRPSGDKFQYSVKSIERFQKFGWDKKRMQKSLFEALESDTYEWAKDLIIQGANPSPVCGFNQNCQPLAWAARAGDLYKIKFLLQYGADINGFNAYYDVALMKALKNNKSEAVKLFIKYKADVNIPNTKGLTPFLTAILMEEIELVKLMLESGAKINDHFLLLTNKSKKDAVGVRPLEAAIKSQNTKLVELILEKNADTRLKTSKGISFLEYAQSLKNKDIINKIEKSIK